MEVSAEDAGTDVEAAEGAAAVAAERPYTCTERLYTPLSQYVYTDTPLSVEDARLFATLLPTVDDEGFMYDTFVAYPRRTDLGSLITLTQVMSVSYRHVVLGCDVIVEPHTVFRAKRRMWRRRRFDCYCSRGGCPLRVDVNGRTGRTSLAQLHFYHVANVYGMIEYARRHEAEIMNASSRAARRRALLREPPSPPPSPPSPSPAVDMVDALESYSAALTCSVCYSDETDVSTDVVHLPCAHQFHRACIRQWFVTATRATCPLCKTPV